MTDPGQEGSAQQLGSLGWGEAVCGEPWGVWDTRGWGGGVLGLPAEYLCVLSVAFSFHLSVVGAGEPWGAEGRPRHGVPWRAGWGERGLVPARAAPASILLLHRSRTPGTARGRAGPAVSPGSMVGGCDVSS